MSTSCQVSKGHPTPNITWAFTPVNENGVIDDNDKQILNDGAILNLENLQAENIGKYSCFVKNQFGHDEYEMTLEVGFAPMMAEKLHKTELVMTQLRGLGFKRMSVERRVHCISYLFTLDFKNK